MLTITEALKVIRKNLPPRRTVQVSVTEALNRMLAEEITSPEDSPAFDNSAMDGFAVRWEDVKEATPENPVLLKIIGESRAGIPYQRQVSAGEAVRINTGAVIPKGADVVIPVEDTRLEGEMVTVLTVQKQWQHVRFRGEEFRKGELLLEAGTKIAPQHVGLLISVGIQQVSVFKSPQIALFTTGSELIAPEEKVLAEGQIRDSNRYMLQAAISLVGGELIVSSKLPDDPQQTVQALRQAGEQADIVLLTGGVSVGPHDHVKAAAEAVGFQPLFWKVAQKPGKPLFVAKKQDTLLFGLPGNPVSTFMCFLTYVYPTIRYFNGQEFALPVLTAQAGQTIENRMKRDHLMRVRLKWGESDLQVFPLPRQGSHMLTTLTAAEGFVIVGAGEMISFGDPVRVYPFPWSQFRNEWKIE